MPEIFHTLPNCVHESNDYVLGKDNDFFRGFRKLDPKSRKLYVTNSMNLGGTDLGVKQGGKVYCQP